MRALRLLPLLWLAMPAGLSAQSDGSTPETTPATQADPSQAGTIATPAGAPPARTADTELARALFERGLEALRNQRWGEAVRHFEGARDVLDHPNIRLNLAAALAQVDRLREAVELYEGLLEDLDPIDATAVREALETVRGDVPTLRIEMSGAVEGDALEIDGELQPHAGTSLEVELDPGSHDIAVRRDRRLIYSQIVQLDRGATRTEAVELPPVATEAPPAAPPTHGEVNPWVVGTLVAGVAVLFGMVYPWARIDGIQNDARMSAYRRGVPAPESACQWNADAGAMGNADITSLCAEADALVIAQWVIGAVGAATLVTSGILALVMGVELQVQSAVATVAVRPFASQRSAGLALEAQF